MKWFTPSFLFVSIVFSSFQSNAGIDSLRVETKRGDQYIVHKVEAKETLFGISRRYAVDVNAISDANPGSSAGLKIGQELLIPWEEKD